ncbi:MAG: hypothetical protein HYZ57_18330, partial [Acidobacteria bacterium]|nr:hypothetical protein [Acidobacteriota bacterium]
MSAIEGRNLNRRGAAWLITAAGLVFLLNAILNYFLFQPGEGMYRGSIEPGYIGTARFIAAHPHLWGWNPLQYCGLPTQFTYVPALPYLSALLTWVTGWPTELSYRLITATAVCLAPVSVFLLVRFFTGARWWALGAAVACTMFSPAYGLVRQIMLDRGVVQLPWRIHIIAKYGESPHSTGLALMPLAVIALWAAATSRSYRKLVLASGLLAAVTLTNWVAGLALGIVCSLMLLAAWRAPDAKEFRTRRALAAAGLAYLLACFWLTPSFIRTIAFNWPVDAFNYQLSIRKWLLLALLLGGIVGLRCLLLAFRRGFYTTWVTLCAFVLGWLIMWFYSKGVEIIPEARRYTLEFELFLMLALIEWLRLAWRSGDQVKRACAVASAGVLLASGLPQAYRYATQVWTRWQPPARETTIEH